MVPAIGSGKIITAPIISDGGQTKEESSTNGDLQDKNGVMSTHLDSSLDCDGHVNNAVSDSEVIQWKRTLLQIGIYMHCIDSSTTNPTPQNCHGSPKVKSL
jgi:hypothetical protein